MMGYDRSKQYGFGEMMFAQLLTSSYLSLAKAGELSKCGSAFTER